MEGEPSNLWWLILSLVGILVLAYLLYRVTCIQYFWHFSNKNARNEFYQSQNNLLRTSTFFTEQFRLDVSLLLCHLSLLVALFWTIFIRWDSFNYLLINHNIVTLFILFSFIYLITNYLPRQKQLNHINHFIWLDFIIISITSILFLPISLVFGPLLSKLNKWIQAYAVKTIELKTKNELENTLENIEDNEQLDAAEKEAELLKSVVKFGEVTVRQIMKSRVDIVSIDKSESFESVVNEVIESGFSRFPVYEEDLDNIVGLLYVKDLLKFMKSDHRKNWHKLIRTNLIFVPESKKIDVLLREFQSKKFHFAIVIDEFGNTSGIVTLEDIVEEIVGEIKDELDDDTEVEYTKIDDRNFIFEGKTLLNDVCRIIDVDTDTFDDSKGNADSLAGLLIEIIGELPDLNEEILYNNFIFKVLAVNKRRIEKVQITLPTEDS